jgi:putative N-acetyltransferase (TIGR04045 family)
MRAIADSSAAAAPPDPGAPFRAPAAGGVEVRIAGTPTELAAYYRVRREVFAEEQGLFVADDRDTHDAEAIPIVALHGGEVVGVVRCYPKLGHTWFGGRLAVGREHRTGTVGARLVKHAVAVMTAREDVHRFLATVQAQNVRFFERLGWVRRGRPFLLAGREHQLMERALAGRAP